MANHLILSVACPEAGKKDIEVRDPGITREGLARPLSHTQNSMDVGHARNKLGRNIPGPCNNYFPYLGPSLIPIAMPIRGILRGSVGRRPAGSAARGGGAKFTTCAGSPRAPPSRGDFRAEFGAER